MQKTISSAELREKFLTFFESKGHARIPSAPLVPENDPSVLFTTAGMHPLIPYIKGEVHPAGKRLVDVQKCLRTTDIEEVGDTSHATVFEMLGNWSLGDYFKKDSITWSWEFLTSKDWLGLDPSYLAVSVFAGDSDAPKDEESVQQWLAEGVSKERIAYLSKDDNWWPTGGGNPGPQGPDTEIFYWTGKDTAPVEFDPTNKEWVEIWNNVFMEFDMTPDKKYIPLAQQNVDTGMGLERTVMILNGYSSIYEIDTFTPLMDLINSVAKVDDITQKRILADHIKAFTFILGDESTVLPSNTDQGYVLRRLIRRAVLAARKLETAQSPEDHPSNLLVKGLEIVTNQYASVYKSLGQKLEKSKGIVIEEVQKFDVAISNGIKEATKLKKDFSYTPTGSDAFQLYATYGLPLELVEEILGPVNTQEKETFTSLLQKHQEKSRESTKGKFKGGLVDHSPQSIQYHTATHLLHQALRTVLGDHVVQKGSNITPERLRFDFAHPAKLTPEEKQAVEALVNEQIKADLKVTRHEMSVPEAKELGALGLFEHKYGDKVSVYTMGDFSKEICGGPHVEHTGVLGHFKITKEEAASAGIRRIKAVLE
jgi:alanyl-tRNA synthetase